MARSLIFAVLLAGCADSAPVAGSWFVDIALFTPSPCGTELIAPSSAEIYADEAVVVAFDPEFLPVALFGERDGDPVRVSAEDLTDGSERRAWVHELDLPLDPGDSFTTPLFSTVRTATDECQREAELVFRRLDEVPGA
ncbi:MAG: hypothetical protein EP330_08305 [Deltaproteobacteria bacterium]|nr:MAG: hypothetical protein EP330_08305 [Deltaproteobacteria bacterium]